MPERDYTVFLRDILTSARRMLSYTKDKSYEEFTGDEILADAVQKGNL